MLNSSVIIYNRISRAFSDTNYLPVAGPKTYVIESHFDRHKTNVALSKFPENWNRMSQKMVPDCVDAVDESELHSS